MKKYLLLMLLFISILSFSYSIYYKEFNKNNQITSNIYGNWYFIDTVNDEVKNYNEIFINDSTMFLFFEVNLTIDSIKYKKVKDSIFFKRGKKYIFSSIVNPLSKDHFSLTIDGVKGDLYKIKKGVTLRDLVRNKKSRKVYLEEYFKRLTEAEKEADKK